MIVRDQCTICDCIKNDNTKNDMEKIEKTHDEQEEISFAVLLALVPAMTMTLFNLMGLI